MAEITNPAVAVKKLTNPQPALSYMGSVYSTLVGVAALCAAVIGLIALSRGSVVEGIVALVIMALLGALAWGYRQQKPWADQLANVVHTLGLLGGLFILVRWLLSILDLANADPTVAAGGNTLSAIWSRLPVLPVNSLPLGDVLLVFAINGGLWFLLRSIRKANRERQIDRSYTNDLESMVQRFFKSTSARVGGVLVVLLLVIVYLMPRVDPYTREIALSDGDLAQRLQPPDCAIGWLRFQQGVDDWQGPGPEPKSILEFPCTHPFGTDKNGRDLTRRVLHGISVSLVVSVISVSISLLIGGVVGLTAGYFSGKWDSILMRLMDIMLAFPALLLAIAIVAMRGPGLENAMLAIGIVSIPTYARLARSMAISLREQDFIMAARSIGASEATVLRRHVLPNSLAPLIVQSTLGLGTAVIETAALGFLGLGQQPPFPELGEMLAESREVMTSGMWWVMAFPGVTVMIIVLSFNLLGDALRDTLDPKLRGQ